MSDTTEDPLGFGLGWEAGLPLQWQVVAGEPDAADQALLNEHNDQVLRLIHGLGAIAAEPVDEPTHQSPELAQMQFKLDLVLDLVSELLARSVEMPPLQACRMTARGLEWSCDEAPPDQALLKISLYPDPSCPRPLQLYGRVVRVLPTESKQLVRVGFEGMTEAVREGLEKLIFQHHRRQVAQTRGQA